MSRNKPFIEINSLCTSVSQVKISLFQKKTMILVYTDKCYNYFISATSFNQFAHTC